MMNLEVNLGWATFQNPVFGASGCTGHGYEMESYTDLARFGAVSLKTFTHEPRLGNRPQRIVEVEGGILSSVGLQNPGKEEFLNRIMPKAVACLRPNQLIISVGGDTVEDYVTLCEEVEERYGDQVAALEINAACPNVNHGAGYYSRDPDAAYALVEEVREAVKLPVFVKLNTNFENFQLVAAGMEAAGADALYTANTPIGMKIDIKTRRPALGNGRGPISGPAIRPIGIDRTWDLYETVKIPIVASGGVCTWQDALEYILAGASAVGVGCIQFVQPNAADNILAGLEKYAEEKGLDSILPLVGAAHS